MSFTTIFTIIMSLVILRILWLRLKAANSHSENFKQLPPKDQLAVLKECLLNNPTETNLQNLKDFFQREKLDIDTESYRPFLKKQLELSIPEDQKKLRELSANLSEAKSMLAEKRTVCEQKKIRIKEM